MSSRAEILRVTAENQPEQQNLPRIDLGLVTNYADPIAAFEEVLGKIGGRVIYVGHEQQVLDQIKADPDKFMINALDCDPYAAAQLSGYTAFQLAHLDKVYLRGQLGVVENGAIWVDEISLVNRLLPFICEHLVIVLNTKQLVPTMHHAYRQINIEETGFGSFIAGPSKTADIEQSLVIGAHGPKHLTVYLVKSEVL